LELLEDRTLLAVWTVGDNSDNPSDVGSLRYAVDKAQSGDTINFASTVTGTITLNQNNGALEVNTDVDIEGPGANVLSIDGNGGQVFAIGSDATATITGLTIADGGGEAGGGVFNSGTLDLTGCTFNQNSVALDGGAILSNGALTVRDCSFQSNTAQDDGGAIFSNGPVAATDCTFSGNTALGQFDSNGGGGGIDNNGTMTVTGCSSASNSVSLTTLSKGGGILNNGTLTATNCTLANNTAFAGGGIFSGGTLTAINCNIANNSADTGGGVENGASLTLNDCTIAGNTAATAGGGLANSAVATVANTIIAKNSAPTGPDLFGAVTSLGYNLFDDDIGGSGFAATDILGVDPLLSPLQFNGGANQTMALLPGSRAIDTGSNALIPAGIVTDQRGDPRIVGGSVDIGAFESRGFSVTVSGGDNQQTSVATAFAAPLSVTVSSRYGEPVAGGSVQATVNGTGASATFPGRDGSSALIDASGTASVPVAANTIVGSYIVSIRTAGSATAAVFNLTNVVGAPSQLVIQTQPSPTATAGVAFNLQPVVLVEDQFGNLETGDSSTKVAATLRTGRGPLQGTTTVTVNGGIATFTNLADDKAETITLLFTGGPLAKVNSTSITISPAAASALLISAPATVTSGKAFSITVTTVDPYDNVATGYRGTVHFTSADRLASLPEDSVFTVTDKGVHVFVNAVILKTADTQTLTVADKAAPSIAGIVTIRVGGGGSPAAVIKRAPNRGVNRSALSQTKSDLSRNSFRAAVKLKIHYHAGQRIG